MTLRPITFLTAVAIAASCSMKEDRALCPCHLAVDLEEASDDAGVKLFLFAGTELISSAEVGPEDIRKPYEEDVPRQEICIAGLQGLASNVIEGRNVIIRTGSQADRIHLHSDYADCTGDRAFVRAGFHKNWASLEICAVNYGSDAGRMEFIVTGDVCGYSLTDRMPVHGDFRCAAELTDPEFQKYSVNLPRQESYGGELHLVIRNVEEGRTVLTCGLSGLLNDSGYDWEKPDLDDILLTFDKAGLDISVTVKDWKEGEDISVSI